MISIRHSRSSTPRRLGWLRGLRLTFVVGLLLSCLLRGPILQGQTADPLSKAKKYHSLLLRRPSPGYLFDRFYDAWLDIDTVDGLRGYLQEQLAGVDRQSATPHRLLLAFFHSKQGDDPLSLEQFRLALQDDPGNAQLWYEKATVEARLLNYETALSDLAKAKQQQADEKLSIQIAKLQGKLFVRNRQSDKALEVWQRLLADYPRDEELHESLIELQLNEGLYQQAAELSEALVAKTRDPYKQVIRGVRTGDIYQRAGNRTKALELYAEKMDQVAANSWIEKEILAQIERLFRREDDLSGLSSHYLSLLETYPKRIALRKRYANLLVDLGETDKALEQFDEVLKITPGDRPNREEYIAVLGRLEMYDKASQQLDALIKQAPNDAELYVQQANLLHQQEKPSQATQAISQYLDASDKSEYAYLRAARQLTQFEQLDEAVRVYEELVQTFPHSEGAQEAMAAFLYDKRDRKDDAITIWRGIARGQDRSQLVRVARILASRKEHRHAFELLKAREADFGEDPIFLGQLITEAMALQQYQAAIPWAAQRVAAAQTVADLEAAIAQAADVVARAEKNSEITKQLRSQAQLSAQQVCLLAELYERNGNSIRADETLAAANVSGVSGQAAKRFIASQQIRLHTGRRDWAQAAAATEKLLALPGGRKSIHVRRLVEFYQRDYKLQKALTWLQEWKKLSPGSTLPWYQEARLLSLQGKTNEALDVLRSAVQLFEDDADLRARLAQAYVEAGKSDDARRLFWRLYEDSQDVSGKLRWAQELGKIANAAGNVEHLIESFQQRRDTNRQSVVPLMAMAEVYRESGDYEERRKTLLEATRIKPDDLELLLHIARIEESENDWERALQTLQQAEKLDKTTKSKERIAQLHLKYGDPDKGYAVLYELAGSDKSDWQSIEAIADAMVGQQDWERVAEFLRPQMDRFSDNYRLRYIYACALEESGEAVEAAEQFARLLECDQEIKGRKSLASSSRGYMIPPQYLQEMQRMLPNDALEYYTLMMQARTVYSHRQNRSARQRYGRTNLQVPSSLDALRPFALAHLVELGRTGLSEEEFAAQKRHVEKLGLANLDIVQRLLPSFRTSYRVDDALVEDFPDNEAILALWAMLSLNSNASVTNPELAKKVFETFRESHPELAVVVGMRAATVDDAFVEPTLQLIPKITQPSTVVMSAVMQAARTQGSIETNELNRALSKQLITWYPTVAQHTQQGAYQSIQLFQMIAAQLAQEEDPSAYLKFLDDEVARSRSGSIPAHNLYRNIVGRQRNASLIQPLSFPPMELPGYPFQVLIQTVGPDTPNSAQLMSLQMSFAGGRNLASSNVTLESLQQVKDPVLRLLFSYKLGEAEKVEHQLKELLTVEPPRIEYYLLASAYEQQQERHARALDLLGTCRHLPMRRSLRKQVDAAIVDSALKLDELDDSQKRLAVDAALRLRVANLQANERQSLISGAGIVGLGQGSGTSSKSSRPKLPFRSRVERLWVPPVTRSVAQRSVAAQIWSASCWTRGSETKRCVCSRISSPRPRACLSRIHLGYGPRRVSTHAPRA